MTEKIASIRLVQTKLDGIKQISQTRYGYFQDYLIVAIINLWILNFTINILDKNISFEMKHSKVLIMFGKKE